MTMQDEQAEDSSAPLSSEQEFPVHKQMPQTPVLAASEQFTFSDTFLMHQDTTNIPIPPSEIIVGDNVLPVSMPPPNPILPIEHRSFIEHSMYPNLPTYPSTPAQTAPFPPQSQNQRWNATTLVALILVIVLVLLGSGGLIYDLGYYLPAQTSLSATAVANAQAASTVAAANTTTANVDATATTQQQTITQTYLDLYQQATSGTPALNDSLNQQTGNQWDEGTFSDKSSCLFQNGSYHVTMPNVTFFVSCYENTQSFADFAFQINMTILNGDKGGILFRSDSNTGKTYLFDIDTLGAYDIDVYTGFQSSQSQRLLSGSTNAMTAGSNQLTVIAEGSSLYFYVNQQFITTTTDATLKSGQVGVLANAYQQSTEVAYSDAKVWVL
ncbi:MAG: hypothetical protein ACRDHZ_15120 [Ktedonobacteraceae bacterium]